MAKKWLYTFTIDRETEVEKRNKSTNEDGKEIEVVEKVKENKPVEFSLRKPTRKLFDAAELFYGVKMSEGIKAGLLTRNLLAKRYEDDGGAFSEAEKRRYSELYLAIYNKEEEYQRLQLNLDNKSQELKDKLAQDLLVELSDLRRELADIESAQSNIFDQTAENRAKNQTIMWWVLKLSHWKEFEHKDLEPFFTGETYDEQLESYDEYEEDEDEFLGEAIRKLAYFVSFWYMGRATSKEDFKTVEELYNTENEIERSEEELEAEEDAKQEALGGSDFDDELEESVEKEKAKKTTAKKVTKKATKKSRGRPKKAKKAKKVEPVEEEVVAESVEESTEEVKKPVGPSEAAERIWSEPAVTASKTEKTDADTDTKI